ncbi:MFS efflux transporter [Stachybotrys elegans]|uniref:MFS efflux transporter n=1 Tax=Stachybotrys elegans TaxID=80388 RepID=A0A8K0SSI4_9HYPO|nr:MFS efflux transporter [Stachybotrys elegans]
MDPILLQTFIQVQSSTSHDPVDEIVMPLTAPAKAISRTYPGAPQPEEPSPANNTDWPASGTASPPPVDEDLERSRPASPVPPDTAAEVLPTIWQPFMNRFRVLAVCMANFSNALNDSAAGALIPYMEIHYNIGYAVVSLIFVGQACGFIVAACLLDTLRARLGRAKLLGLAQLLMALAYLPMIVEAPFAVVACSFFLVGFGIAVNVAMGNIFCGGLQNGTLMLGLLHGSYGIGGTTGPLIATAIVTVANAVWSRYYILTMAACIAVLVLAVWSFWGYEREQGAAAREKESYAGKSVLLGMVNALKLRIVLLGSLFIFAYQGAEVSISGWVISFLINVRDGDPSSVGYVSAGFWAGITLGRFLLAAPAQRIGEKVFVYGLIVGAIAFQTLVWAVPNIVGNAVAVSIVGLLLGPIYPCAAAVMMRGIAPREVLSGMGAISAMGSLGGALCPFVTGLLAQAVGTWVLHPIVLVLFVVMIACWYSIPAEHKRTE